MKLLSTRFCLWISLVCFFSCLSFDQSLQKNTPFVIVTASYNNAKYYKQNLESVFAQKYKNWRLIYIDDNSPDNTGKLVEEYIEQRGFAGKVTLIKNKERRLALANMVNAIHTCQDKEVVVSLDGDDALFDTEVLSYLNTVYADPNIWLTFGSFVSLSDGSKCTWVRDYPREVKEKGQYREYAHMLPTHLKTFYAGLFKKINLKDLKQGKNFFDMTQDVATMIPMIEMAGAEHYKFIERVLCTYNDLNELNDHKVNSQRQMFINKIIREYKTPYLPLINPPY